MIIWKRVTLVLVTVTALTTGCSGGPDRVTTTPVPSTASSAPALACEGDDCGADGQEVKTTGCDEPATDASPVRDVKAMTSIVNGEVVVRKSTAKGANCDRLYWAKLRSTDGTGYLTGNTQGYILEFTAENASGSKRVVTQQSDNPVDEALSKTIKGRDGWKMTACVQAVEGKNANRECVEVDVDKRG